MNSQYLHNVTGIKIKATEVQEMDGAAYGSRQLIISFNEGSELAITLFADGASLNTSDSIKEALALTDAAPDPVATLIKTA